MQKSLLPFEGLWVTGVAIDFVHIIKVSDKQYELSKLILLMPMKAVVINQCCSRIMLSKETPSIWQDRISVFASDQIIGDHLCKGKHY